MSQSKIRLAASEDAEEVARLLRSRAASDGDPTEYLTADIVHRDLLGPRALAQAAVAERSDGTGLAGVATWHPAVEVAYAARGAYVPELVVDPDQRRQGLATALLAFIAARVREQDGVYLWIMAYRENEAARTLYGRLADIVSERSVSYAIALEPFERLADQDPA